VSDRQCLPGQAFWASFVAGCGSIPWGGDGHAEARASWLLPLGPQSGPNFTAACLLHLHGGSHQLQPAGAGAAGSIVAHAQHTRTTGTKRRMKSSLGPSVLIPIDSTTNWEGFQGLKQKARSANSDRDGQTAMTPEAFHGQDASYAHLEDLDSAHFLGSNSAQYNSFERYPTQSCLVGCSKALAPAGTKCAHESGLCMCILTDAHRVIHKRQGSHQLHEGGGSKTTDSR
jgi:hypothetical protein